MPLMREQTLHHGGYSTLGLVLDFRLHINITDGEMLRAIGLLTSLQNEVRVLSAVVPRVQVGSARNWHQVGGQTSATAAWRDASGVIVSRRLRLGVHLQVQCSL